MVEILINRQSALFRGAKGDSRTTMHTQFHKTCTFIAIALLSLTLGCQSNRVNRDYRLDELEIISEGVVENGIKLTYRVPGETLYHSRGAVVKTQSPMTTEPVQ